MLANLFGLGQSQLLSFGFECSAPVIRQEFDPGREEWEIDKAKAFGRTHD